MIKEVVFRTLLSSGERRLDLDQIVYQFLRYITSPEHVEQTSFHEK